MPAVNGLASHDQGSPPSHLSQLQRFQGLGRIGYAFWLKLHLEFGFSSLGVREESAGSLHSSACGRAWIRHIDIESLISRARGFLSTFYPCLEVVQLFCLFVLVFCHGVRGLLRGISGSLGTAQRVELTPFMPKPCSSLAAGPGLYGRAVCSSIFLLTPFRTNVLSLSDLR